MTTRRTRRIAALLSSIPLLLTGCPDAAVGSDGATNDLADVNSEALDASDVGDAPRDDLAAMDVTVPECVPGRSVPCACTNGRLGAQTCLASRTWGACVCAQTPDAGRPDVVLPPVGPRLIAPGSMTRVTSQRPTMRWVLPSELTRARVELCADRACTRSLIQQEVIGNSWRPTARLSPGVVFWRVRGLATNGSVAWTSATWEYGVRHRDAPVDTSFGTLKDFNGDGYDDAAVVDTIDFPREEFAKVIYGRANEGEPGRIQNIASTALRTLAVGDFNGDGFADLAIAQPEGPSVEIFHGAPAGLSRTASRSFVPVVLYEDRGVTIPGDFQFVAGDWNGDGFSDIAVVERHRSSHPDGTYFLRLFRGSPDSILPVAAGALDAPLDFADFGEILPREMKQLQNVGDVNADGYDDLLLTYERTYRENRGRAWIVAGHTTFPTDAWFPIEPPNMRTLFGLDGSRAGDVNGDGIADFLISANEQVFVYLGMTGAIATRPTQILNNPIDGCFIEAGGLGGALGMGGDFNGDGFADLAIGAPCLPARGSVSEGEGMVFVYSGRAGSIDGEPTRLVGERLNSFFGGRLEALGDFNGDGFDDLGVLNRYTNTLDKEFPARLSVFRGTPSGVQQGIRFIFDLVDGTRPILVWTQSHTTFRGV